MDRVLQDEQWTLFEPSKAPQLASKYGLDWNIAYERLEDAGQGLCTVRARSLWVAIVQCQLETGGPAIVFRDSMNGELFFSVISL